MNMMITKVRVFASVAVATVFALAGCTDNDYDFNEVDSTIGVGSESGLTLPASSTDTILLADVLDIDDADCIVIDEDTKDYIFRQEGGDVTPANPKIDVMHLVENGHESKTISVDVPELPDVPNLPGIPDEIDLTKDPLQPIDLTGSIQILNYEGDMLDGLKKLVTVDADNDFTLKLILSADMKKYVKKLDAFMVTFPEYLVLKDVKVGGKATTLKDGHIIDLGDVSTATDVVITGKVNKIDFSGNDALEYKEEGGKKTMVLKGNIDVSMSIRKIGIGLSKSSTLSITGDIDIKDFTLTGVTGYFNPTIDLPDLGDIDITGVPDFLTGDNVVVDVYNPQIALTLTNTMEIGGFVSGTLKAVKNGKVTEVNVPASGEIEILPFGENLSGSGETRICICRDADRMTEAEKSRYDRVYSVPDLGKLLHTIPDHISFSAAARADDSKLAKFVFGYDKYEVKPAYSFEAPLAFGKDAKICYNDTIADLNDDIKDLDLIKGSYIQVTATIENTVPFYLKLKAEALGRDGKKLGEDKVKVVVDETIKASPDGKTPTETPIVIRIEQPEAGALAELDAIAVAFEGDASVAGQPVVEGVRLNSEKNFIIARDIKVTLKGMMIVGSDD